jgi:proteic killer suppression protein
MAPVMTRERCRTTLVQGFWVGRMRTSLMVASDIIRSFTLAGGKAMLYMVIESFRHAGLEKFFMTGSKKGIQPAHAKRLRILLTALDAASRPETMNQPGYAFHELKGDRAGTYSVKVNGSWRLTFDWKGSNAILTNYEDYH